MANSSSATIGAIGKVRLLLPWLLLFGLLVFLSFNRHSKSGFFNYHSELWADKAGYYVYLPTVITFGGDVSAFPDSIAQRTGSGFELDRRANKVFTKYPIGVALLQLPFFAVAETITVARDLSPRGFSPAHHRAINVAAVFYLVIGLYFVYRFLRFDFNRRISGLTVFVVLSATHLFYYGVDETGMSHVYSFFLFAAFLLGLRKTNFLRRSRWWEALLMGGLIGLMLVTRPTAILLLPAFVFLDREGVGLKARFDGLRRPQTLLSLTIGGVLVILPQLVWWKVMTGDWVSYSYGDEGFNWLHPQVVHMWFSPNNGLFLYTPVFVLILVGMWLYAKRSLQNARFVAVLFAVMTYVFAAWWSWDYGCSFGARSYVEYLAILSLPLAAVIAKWESMQLGRWLGRLLILACVVFTLKLTYTYDECYYGDNDWDWSYYRSLITAPTK